MQKSTQDWRKRCANLQYENISSENREILKPIEYTRESEEKKNHNKTKQWPVLRPVCSHTENVMHVIGTHQIRTKIIERYGEIETLTHTERERETRRRQQNNKYHGTIEMMKTDTMQFELILLMRLTRNNNIQTIRFIPRKTNQIEARRMEERERERGWKPNQKTNIKWRNKCDRFALARARLWSQQTEN